ncbi:hypothetical protein ERO13_A05G377550v2 [Gossypium hirsutum]|uniref:Uncharacterized protein n=3 Tax=Gossypium TaxID=3633 RepID=A0A5D2ZJX1_GOSMU|nr:hypothetical protein ERO13_A05G377550v2 [Gossypium hirsutum]TYJ37920.1 hypothetical protein E1A91_A05G408500v1 [Gossypium mustelinum]TYJ37921.1 hypothetical protein E1A91_A05G408500v1 [Gossypium mustelinum]
MARFRRILVGCTLYFRPNRQRRHDKKLPDVTTTNDIVMTQMWTGQVRGNKRCTTTRLFFWCDKMYLQKSFGNNFRDNYGENIVPLLR